MYNRIFNYIHKSVLLIAFLILSNNAYATHNRAGEITYKQTGPLTIEMTITTYTKTSSSGADRDSLDVFWGDGTTEIIKRVTEIELPNDVKKNEYTETHTYPGRGTYTIYFLDPNRVGNILNVNYPNSIDVPFFLSTTFTLLNTQFQGFNNSAILLQPPIDIACVGQKFVHNPNAFDPDGDSLAYELVEPLMDAGVPVPNYKFPHEILPGPNNVASINAITGDFVWMSPPQQGDYNIAIKIKEYRKGVLINCIIRDMQIRIILCDNTPPTITAIDEICVIAGEKLELDFKIDDIDEGQKVWLSATGGPFVVDGVNKATISNINEYKDVAFNSTFSWQTDCNHISNQPYQIVLRAVDNAFSDTLGLASFHTLRIRVVGPPPENLDAISTNGAIGLEWDAPYLCEVTENDFFQGFSIWRKQSPNPFIMDTCKTGLENYNYKEVIFLTKQKDADKYFHIDDSDLLKGLTYCYRIQAEFALITSSGSLYNRVESLPSNEICLQISRDLPLITKVSVQKTDLLEGEIHVRWAKPLISELDTIENPGPYRINIERSILGANDFSIIPGSDRSFNFISPFIDTNYIDTNINTLENQYNYRINLFTGASSTIPYGTSGNASSIFLTLTPSDRRLTLNWSDETPWTNFEHVIYKQDDNGIWNILAKTPETNYLELKLINEKEYCYYIEATGTYSLRDLEDPIINLSQIACAEPIDDIAPCGPNLTVTNLCEDVELISSADELINTLTWTDANMFCDRTEKIIAYNLYYAPLIDAEFELLATVDGQGELTYSHSAINTGLAGCYAVTAIDSLGNESELSNTVCKENCPLYSLPNTFTPNDDGANDLFVPLKNVFISKIEFSVFNQWGNLVFESQKPEINWKGRDMKTDKALHPGSYYYVCKVFAESTEGVTEIKPQLSGYINLIK